MHAAFRRKCNYCPVTTRTATTAKEDWLCWAERPPSRLQCIWSNDLKTSSRTKILRRIITGGFLGVLWGFADNRSCRNNNSSLLANTGRHLLPSAANQRPHTHNTFGDRSFAAAGPQVWHLTVLRDRTSIIRIIQVATENVSVWAVSYTHLTLPTIYSV